MSMPPSFTVEIVPAGLRFEAAPGTPLLLAAEQAGIVLPSSCRNGSCRTCLARVLAGAVEHVIEWPGLSADEQREGYVLPCCAVARSALTLQATARRQSSL